jgi:transposase-like protein
VTRRRFTPEEKVRLVIEGIRGEIPVGTLCRREWIRSNIYHKWLKDLKKQLFRRCRTMLVPAGTGGAEDTQEHLLPVATGAAEPEGLETTSGDGRRPFPSELLPIPLLKGAPSSG